MAEAYVIQKRDLMRVISVAITWWGDLSDDRSIEEVIDAVLQSADKDKRIDELTEETEKLREEIEKLRDENARYKQKITYADKCVIEAINQIYAVHRHLSIDGADDVIPNMEPPAIDWG